MEGSRAQEPVILTGEDGEEITLYVMDTTRIAGVEYLLAAENEDEETDAYIFRMAEDGDDYVLEMVTDPSEFDYIAKVFTEQSEDIDTID